MKRPSHHISLTDLLSLDSQERYMCLLSSTITSSATVLISSPSPSFAQPFGVAAEEVANDGEPVDVLRRVPAGAYGLALCRVDGALPLTLSSWFRGRLPDSATAALCAHNRTRCELSPVKPRLVK
ncbi:hypothetical protein GGTG_05326 [Gaeumannomyces tritici R3-111a-1]|uniref:Uncharacterized protein n=1 Tax=Gaeumannomyces tritici (strain R3-111a-1) TaxID=644352 RepID=J3NVL1_GAET3|nr:hypothetical protein GGTG_05326 [Gaeumannomyces tritici R3-111a-1]EJT75389.1 hypothetical protein GGTG_05326 [Gaeumannomyces tritici R3-111a-1]